MAYGKKVGPQLPFQASLRGTGPPTAALISGLCCAASVALASGTVSYTAQAVAPLSVVAYANPVESDTDSGIAAATSALTGAAATSSAASGLTAGALAAFGAGQVSHAGSGLSAATAAAIGDGSLIQGSAPAGGIVRVVGPGLPFQARQLSTVIVQPSTPIAADGTAVASSVWLGTLSVDTATYVGLPIAQQWGPAFLFTSGPRSFTTPQTLTLAGVASATTVALAGLASSLAANGQSAPSSVLYGDLQVGALDGLSALTLVGFGGLSIDFAPLPTVVSEQFSGGWPYYYDRELQRRREEKRKRELLEEATEQIQAPVDRDIGRLLRDQEAKDARKVELQRLRSLADTLSAKEAEQRYGERVATALERAVRQGNFSALEALDRELARARTEEEFLLLAIKMLLEQE